ncbi:MAG TPA: hypothetical protein VFO93_13220 [Hymenobacter sp.]|uniref:hypothetical protein n=1 Tax=Hymenobacter sp. TaxID=1898978 RepID=UPI002D80D909|nr:hypothetical protein [Hymenobacter sp.]HET9504495.1 hypothetical protein [Hymenobacter sp.]
MLFTSKPSIVLGTLGLLASLATCQNHSGQGETATADSLATSKPASVDPAATKRLLAARRDSLRADSIARKTGQLPGAILPGHRIVAFYGNIRSKGMGILGRVPKDSMMRQFDRVLKEWQDADPSLPVMPCFHSVTITAQAAAGADKKYRLMNSASTIEETRAWAKEKNALLFLDVQVGLSDLEHELPKLTEYLKDPTIHLGIDPEFAMITKKVRPGKKIGTYDAKDINYAIDFLARIVTENHLPPKMLMVHRFTKGMVTNYKDIKLDPRVQVIMDMDGWGNPTLKKDSYKAYITKEPVQYAGFKLFYEYDPKQKPHHMMTPAEVLDTANLKPTPLYVQYQ